MVVDLQCTAASASETAGSGLHLDGEQAPALVVNRASLTAMHRNS